MQMVRETEKSDTSEVRGRREGGREGEIQLKYTYKLELVSFGSHIKSFQGLHAPLMRVKKKNPTGQTYDLIFSSLLASEPTPHLFLLFL